jgi:hypothetical protein
MCQLAIKSISQYVKIKHSETSRKRCETLCYKKSNELGVVSQEKILNLYVLKPSAVPFLYYLI